MKNFIYCVTFIMVFVDIISAATVSTTTSNAIERCMEDGGYCQSASDCCSNRCLSFSYKCVKASPLYSSANIFVPDDSAVPIDTLEELVNRFGSEDNKTTEISTTKAPCVGIGYTCGESADCCSNECLHYRNFHVCIEANLPSVTEQQCLVIGQKCYRHEECCSKRCHGFLHQCVT